MYKLTGFMISVTADIMRIPQRFREPKEQLMFKVDFNCEALVISRMANKKALVSSFYLFLILLKITVVLLAGFESIKYIRGASITKLI